MAIILARRELSDCWNAPKFEPERVARAIAKLLELVDYDIERFAFERFQLVGGSHVRND